MEKDRSIDASQIDYTEEIAKHKKAFESRAFVSKQTNPIVTQFVKFSNSNKKFSIKDSYFR